MSEVVDNRIVEMQFDNADFEKNIRESLQSLHRIERAINNLPKSASGFKDLSKSANSLDFSKLVDNVDAIAKRMSVTGIATMKVITDVTGFVERKVIGLGKKISSMIAEGGKNRAANIQKAKFQLEGLGIAWNDISEDIDHGVKDTAYGLDAAANAASQLSASGVEFGKVFGATGNSPMAKALRGISGVAAMTQSSYEEIAHIFTTVAGQGRMMTMQLNQVAGRGLNVASTIVDFMNKISKGTDESLEHISDQVKKTVKDITKGKEITEEQLRELVTKGKIDFAIFSEAMDDAFGEHAKDANRTYEGVLSNIRSAFSRIGQNFFEPLKENGGAVVRVLNEVRELVNAVNKATKETIRGVARSLSSFLNKIAMISQYLTDNGGWANVIEGFGNVLKTVGDIIAPLIMAFRKFVPEVTAQKVLELTKRFKELTEQLRLSDSTMENIFLVARMATEAFGALKDVIFTLISSLSPGTKSVLSLADSFLYGTAYVLAFTAALIKYIFTAERIEKFADGIKNGFTNVFNSVKNLLIDLKNFASALFDVLGELEVVQDIGKTLSDVAWVIAYVLVNGVKKATEALKALREALHDVNREDLRPYIQSLNGVLTVFWNLIKTIGGAVFNAFAFVYDAVKSLGLFNREIEKTEKPLRIADQGIKIFNKATKTLSDSLKTTSGSANNFTGNLKAASSESSKYLKNVTSNVSMVRSELSKTNDEWKIWKINKNTKNKLNPTEDAEAVHMTLEELKRLKHTRFDDIGSPSLDHFIRNSPGYSETVTDFTGVVQLSFNKMGEAIEKNKIDSGIKNITHSTEELRDTLAKLPVAQITNTTKETKKNLDQVMDSITGLNSSSTKLYDTVSKLKLSEALTKGIPKTAETTVSGLLNSIIQAILNSVKRVSPALAAFGSAIIEGIKLIFNRVKTFVGGLIDQLKKLDWGRGVVLAFVAVITYAIFKIAKTVGSIPYLVFNVTKSMANMTAAFKGLVGGKADSIYDGVVKIAMAIAIFAGSLKLMSTIDVTQLQRCVAIVAGFVATLLGFTFLFANFTSLPFISEIFGSTGFNMMARGVMAFGAAFAALAISLKILEDLDINKVTNSLATFLIVLTTFSTAAVLVMPTLKGLTKGSIAILAFALAITSIVKALVKLQELSPEQIDSGLAGISLTIIALAALTETAKAFPLKSGLGILALVAAIMLLPKAFDAIIKSDFNFEYLAKNIQQLLVAFVLLAAMAGVIRIAGQAAIGVAASVLAITVALKMLPGIIDSLVKTIESSKSGSVDSAMRKIVSFLLSLTIVFALVAGCSGLSLKAAPIFLSIAAAVLTLGVCLKLLSTIDGFWNNVAVMAMLGEIFAVLAVLFMIAKAAESASLKSILGLAGVILILSVSLSVISFIPWQALLPAAGAMTAVLLGMALCFNQLAKMDSVSIRAYKAALSMTLALAVIAGSLYLLNGLNIISLGASAFVLGGLVVTLSFAINKIAGLKTKEAVPAILALSVMVAALGGALVLLAKFCDPVAVGVAAVSLFVLSIALGVFLAIADQMKNAESSAKSLLIISIGLIAIAGAFYILGQLNMKQIGAGLVAIGAALLILVGIGALIGHFAAVSAGLTALAVTFMEFGIAAIEFGVAAALVGAGVMLLSVAFSIFSKSLEILSGIDLVTLSVGLINVSGAIGMITGALLAFTVVAVPLTVMILALAFAVGLLSKALFAFGLASIAVGAGILLVAGGFTIFANALSSISELGIGTIALGLIGLGASLVVLTAASLPFMVIAIPLSLLMVALAAAIGILSAALAAFATSIGMIAASLSAISAFGEAVEKVQTGIQGVVETVKGKVGEFVEAGKSLIGGIADGINSGIDKIKEVGGTISSAMKEGWEQNGITGMVGAGADAVKGLVLGVHSNLHEAIAAFSGLAESALYDGFAPTAEWESPWGTLIRAGGDAVKGLSEGIKNNVSDVSKSGKELGLKILDGFRDAVGWHSRWQSMVDAMKDCVLGIITGGQENAGAGFDFMAWLGDMLGMNLENGFAPHADNIQNMINDLMGQAQFDYEKERRFLNKKLGQLEYDPHTQNNSGEWSGNNNNNPFNDGRYTRPKSAGATSSGGGGGGGGGSTAETKKSTEIMDYATKVVEKYSEAFGRLYETAGDTTGLEASKSAVTELAKAMYEAQGNILDGTDEKLAEALEAFKTFSENMKKSMKDTLKSTEEFKESFDFKPKDLMKNMDSNKKALNKWWQYLKLAAMKGIDKNYLLNITNAGFSAESLNELRYMCSLHSDAIDEYNKRIQEADKETEDSFNTHMSELLAIFENAADKFKADNDFTLALKEKFTDWRTIVSEYMLNYDEIVQKAEEGYKQSLQHFKKFTVSKEDREITIGSLIENEKSQIKAQEMFTQHLTEIIDKGGSQELIDHIMDMGYEQGYAYAKSISDGSEEEIKELGELFHRAEFETPKESSEDLGRSYAAAYTEGLDQMFTEMGEYLREVANGEHQGFIPDDLSNIMLEVAKAICGDEETARDALNYFNENLDTMFNTLVSDNQAAGMVTNYAGTLAASFANGFNNPEATEALSTAADGITGTLTDAFLASLDSHEGSLEKIEEIGSIVPFSLENGIIKNITRPTDAAESLADGLVEVTEGIITLEKFRDISDNIIEGLKQGLYDGKDDVLNAIEDLCEEALDTMADGLEEASPSKATARFGKFFDLGFANGVSANAGVAIDATKSLAERTVESFNTVVGMIDDILAENMDYTPSIVPVLDTSMIQNGVGYMNGLFGNDFSLGVGANYANAMSRIPSASEADESSNGNTGNTYNFTQNNYSPKALSRLDIYRQTRNQFTRMKGVVEAR